MKAEHAAQPDVWYSRIQPPVRLRVRPKASARAWNRLALGADTLSSQTALESGRGTFTHKAASGLSTDAWILIDEDNPHTMRHGRFLESAVPSGLLACQPAAH